ncbi:MAG: oligosaccharide flippase family protein [Verrucomicrobiota bacterium]
MSVAQPPNPTAPQDTVQDVSGRGRMVQNVLGSWGAQCVFIVAGFIMPRMIDGHLGQESLGIWDFGWSVVAYFDLVSLGVIGSINRYVAMHRATGNLDALNRTISSVFCILSVVSAFVVLLSVGAAVAVPQFAQARVGAHSQEVAWVILFLGLASALQTWSYIFAGVLTGCHHWRIHNMINAGGYALAVTGMLIALALGCGLGTLAVVYLFGEVLRAGVRFRMAYWACPDLKVRMGLADWKTARGMMHFGSKSFVPQVAELLLNQTVSILIVCYLGAAALALYSRPRSLVLQVRTLVYKMAAVLTPAASSLQALKSHADIAALVIKATRYGVFLTLPLTITFVVFGGPLMQLWMGPRYDDSALFMILAIGYASFIIQVPALSILTGLNIHGQPGLVNLAVSIGAAGAVALTLGPLKLGLRWMAVAATFPLAITYAVYLPLYTCRRLNIAFDKYVQMAVLDPLLTLIPFAACLVAVRLALPHNPRCALFIGGVLGGMVLGLVYWRKVLPGSLKTAIRQRCTRMSLSFVHGT